MEVRRIPHKQHVSVGRVCDPYEARLVLQRRRDANAGGAGEDGAVAVGPARPRPRHHLAHGHAGELQQGRIAFSAAFSGIKKLFWFLFRVRNKMRKTKMIAAAGKELT